MNCENQTSLYSLWFIVFKKKYWRFAGWQGDQAAAAGLQGFPGGEVANATLAPGYFNYRKTTIYGGSNEVQRNIVAQTVLG